MHVSELIEQDFPATIQELIGIMGLKPTLKLMRSYGGTYLSIPSRYKDTLKLVGIVGRRASRALIQVYSGDRLYIAKIDTVVRTTRDSRIVGKHKEGVSVCLLARRYKLSERQVWNIIKASHVRDMNASEQLTLCGA